MRRYCRRLPRWPSARSITRAIPSCTKTASTAPRTTGGDIGAYQHEGEATRTEEEPLYDSTCGERRGDHRQEQGQVHEAQRPASGGRNARGAADANRSVWAENG